MTDREQFIILLDTDNVSRSDAIILLEGDGFSRYREAVRLYKEGIAPVICFSGNYDDEVSGAFTYDKIKPLILSEGVLEGHLEFEAVSKNTYEQAVEVVRIARERRWSRIVLVASHYHSYRAFLTFLCVQKDMYPALVLDMASVKDLDWYEETGYGVRLDLLDLEFQKIDVYQKQNNVATYREGIEYLKWKYLQQKG